ncbi:uncharacterized protein LOC124163637 isoform X2 [Ischnura elegans]|uniref:uncharacterized protein LOC124163637 isoform X2 n=1 Tax=Ischnura elegans TaxID=197161 RepID=UPI001ED8B8DC|nr:uncharacterized protein LOC124163637 isoform X2 [Ischnura elegans]XP_046396639.1 uncharacterized protein LOC124163637 isoform X2 [Ischnura elegans]
MGLLLSRCLTVLITGVLAAIVRRHWLPPREKSSPSPSEVEGSSWLPPALPPLLTSGPSRGRVGTLAGTEQGPAEASVGGGGGADGAGSFVVGSVCGCRRKRGGGGRPMASDREACGLGALLPGSCRGRAESFARRLHTRLRSLGGSTELLPDDEEEDAGVDSGGGWGVVSNGEDGGSRAALAEATGGRVAEGGVGCTKYRSTDREPSGGVTVQQPLSNASSSLPGGHSPSPPTGSSPPYSTSPRTRLDSGLESLGSPTSGTPPRPGSNGSESGVAGISSPSNGYFSPPNEHGFGLGRWNASPSPEGDHRNHHSRSPYQRPPRRKKDIKWPPSGQQTETVESGEAALPNFLECFPQTGVDSPPETSWSTSSMSPENGASGGGSATKYQGAAGGGDDVDRHFASEACWHQYAYARHHHHHNHHARSPATSPLPSPDALPRHHKGVISPTSYTPPCSPVSPDEAAALCLQGSHSPSSALKSPISEVNEEEEETAYKLSGPEYLPLREDSDEQLNGGGGDYSSLESNGLLNSSSDEGVKPDEVLTNGHSSEHVPIVQVQDSSDQCDTSSGDQPDSYTAVSLLSFEVSRVNLSVSTDSEEVKSEDEVDPLLGDRKFCEEKTEKVAEDEEGFSEDSMERDIQTLAETIYGKLEEEPESPEEEKETRVVSEIEQKQEGENDVDPHYELAVGECSPVEGPMSTMELRKKYLDADSSDMDLKAVRIICEEMASRSKIVEGELVIIGITDEDGGKTEVKEEGESETPMVGDDSCKEKIDEAKDGEEDEVEVEERTPRVRRSTSLKTGKTPPGTPSRKKIVRFADVLGLDLADVRTFLDEIPNVPRSAFQDLAPEASLEPSAAATMPLWSSPANWNLGMTPSPGLPRRPRKYHLMPLFPQPGAAADFLDRVRERYVCLESAVEEDADEEEDDGSEFFGVNGWSVLGTVRVRNLAFHKTVHARASADGWRSHADVPASYLPGSCDGFSDRFAFELRPGIPQTGGGLGAGPFPRRIPNGGRLELAVRFQCQGSQYWDNNSGVNYVFSVEPVLNRVPSPSSERETQERPPATPAPVRSQESFRYLSLPSHETDWATFL